jgi:hypothetical protein
MRKVDLNRAFCGLCAVAGLGIGLIGAVHGARAATENCPDSGIVPQVKIEVLPGTVRLIPGVARDDVVGYRIDEQGNPLPVPDDEGKPGTLKTIGLTNAHFTNTYSYSVQSDPGKGGVWCSSVTKLVYSLGYVSQEVYIPRDYPPGSCEYRAVHDHEMEHVKANQQALADHLDSIHALALSALMANQPYEVKTKEAIAEAAKARLVETLSGVLADFEADRAVRNANLDSEENYQAISDQCDNW